MTRLFVGDNIDPYFTLTYDLPESPPVIMGEVVVNSTPTEDQKVNSGAGPEDAHLIEDSNSNSIEDPVPECLASAQSLLVSRSTQYAELPAHLAKVTSLDVMGWITAGSRKVCVESDCLLVVGLILEIGWVES